MKRLLVAMILLATALFANVGKVTAVKGEAKIIRNSQNILINIGSIIEEKDKIIIGEKSRLQLVFNDKTVISLGKNTTFDVEEYFYDENHPEKTVATFKVLKGVFKSITGRIGKINPSNFKLKTKSASIGIRGTIFFGQINPNGEESIACTQGLIIVETAQGTIDIPAGQFTKVEFGKAPTPPTQMTEKQKKSLEKASGSKEEEEEEEASNSNNASNIASSTLNSEQQSSIQSNLEDENTKNNNTDSTATETETANESATETETIIYTYNKTYSTNNFDFSANYTTFATTLTPSQYNLTQSKQSLEIKSDDFSLNTDMSDDEIYWGFWGSISDNSNLDTFNAQTAWITGKNVVTDIESTFETGIASYTGKIMGFTSAGDFIDPSNSTINLTFDFGADIADVILYGAESEIANFTGGTYTTSGNEYTIVGGDTTLSGSFFNQGDTTAGKFKIDNIAKGVYKAKKD